MDPLAILIGIFALSLALNISARVQDRRRDRRGRRGWRLASRRRPVKRFKGRIRMLQWGEFANIRDGRSGPPYYEPPVVTYRDFANFIRLWPNPGYTITRRDAIHHWCRSKKCPTPRRQER